jgi:hypothetical protein
MKIGDEEGLRWLQGIMREIATLRVGATRRELLVIFEPDGGLAPIPNPRFVHRRYPIKIDVTFAARADGEEREDDRVTTLSKPYLALKTMD